MNWSSIEPEELVRIVDYWRAQDWPLVRGEIAAAMAGLGWSIGTDGRWEAATLPFYRQTLMVVVSDEDIGLDELLWHLTDRIAEESKEREVFMNDVYASCVAALACRFGLPRNRRREGVLEAIWDFQGQCRVKVIKRANVVGIDFLSPERAGVERELEFPA